MKTFIAIVALILGLVIGGILIAGFIGIYDYLDFEYLSRITESGVVVVGIVLVVAFLFALVCLAVYLWSKATSNVVSQRPASNPVYINSGEQSSARGKYLDYGDHRRLELGSINREELTMLIADVMQRSQLSSSQFPALPEDWSSNRDRQEIRSFK